MSSHKFENRSLGSQCSLLASPLASFSLQFTVQWIYLLSFTSRWMGTIPENRWSRVKKQLYIKMVNCWIKFVSKCSNFLILECINTPPNLLSIYDCEISELHFSLIIFTLTKALNYYFQLKFINNKNNNDSWI